MNWLKEWTVRKVSWKRTIEEILPFSLSVDQMLYLEQAGICNGCGGEGENIDKQLRAMIELLPWFDESKVDALFNDMRKICFAHDADFFFKRGFYLSNFIMAKRVFHLLHWAGWKRIFVATCLFYALSRYWKPFYSNKKLD